jgi:hypothetical protein
MVAHSLLMSEMQQSRASAWAHRILTTIGEACRAITRETLWKTIHWVIDRITLDHWSDKKIQVHLATEPKTITRSNAFPRCSCKLFFSFCMVCSFRMDTSSIT